MRATALLAVLLIVGILALAAVLDDVLYRRAERYYQAGDFERASLWSERALRLNSSHAPARALFTEVQFILGQGKAPATTGEYDKYVTCDLGVGVHAQTLVDIDHALARAYGTDDTALATLECRKVLEYVKWLPDSAELRAQRDRARAYLECVSGSAASAR